MTENRAPTPPGPAHNPDNTPHHWVSLLVCYDIVDDDTRADVAQRLMALGPKVQLSVFEARVANRRAIDNLVTELAAIIDPTTDQVRVYNLGGRPANPTIVGSRTIEEWRDYMIV